MTMVAVEGEYAFGYTKLTGEIMRDRFETALGSETAYAWFVQGMHDAVAALVRRGTSGRHVRAAAPHADRHGTRTTMQTTEATVGYRITADLTARGSFMRRKAFTRPTWDRQAGFSLVWAHRWR